MSRRAAPPPPAPDATPAVDWFADLEGQVEYAVMTRDVRKLYRMGDTDIHALDGVTITIRTGEYISIMGPSGSGKTTLFNAIGGLMKPTSGSVFIDEVDVAQLDANELAWLRCRKIGYIFQSYNIVTFMTALENVTLPMLFAGVPPDEAQERGRGPPAGGPRRPPAAHAARVVRRSAAARRHRPRLRQSPAIILADEPTANLDLKTGEEIINLMKEMNREFGVTVICATHDHKMLDISDRIVWMRDGRVERIADRRDVSIHIDTMRERR
jgi:putative ABC transport system ATP-binding protein